MNPTDKQVRFGTVIFILLHVVIGIGCLADWTPMLSLYLLNFVSGSLIVGYWVRKQIIITQHIFEIREITYVSFELFVAGLSGYTVLTRPANSIMSTVHYSIAALHLLGLIMFLIFMLTFKIRKLF